MYGRNSIPTSWLIRDDASSLALVPCVFLRMSRLCCLYRVNSPPSLSGCSCRPSHPYSLEHIFFLLACRTYIVTYHLKPCQYECHLWTGTDICFLTTLFSFTVSCLIISTANQHLAWCLLLWNGGYKECGGLVIENVMKQTTCCNWACVSF